MGSGDRSTLVRICDPAGRPRGTGFVADDRGTVVTSHEAVDGLLRLVLHGTGDRSCRVEADAITALPELDLALVRTGGLDVLGVEPLPIVLRDRIEAGTYVRIAAHGWREARVLGVGPVTYTATDRSYRVGAAMELALGTDGRDALRLRGAAVGGPVLDPDSGAVIAVVGTALRGEHPAAGFAVPLVGVGTDAPLGALLRRNATTVPGYGRDLNLAGALQLAAMSIGAAGGPGARPDPVERPDVTAEFTAFTAAGERPEVVLGLVAEPGTGRTTELADLTASQAERARERYAIPADALAPGHDRHPLTLRLLAEVRAALPGDVAGQPDTDDVFGAHLDLMCLRIAVRIAAASRPALRGTAVRRLAARVTGQVHEAARRCLGPGQGELDRAAFEEIFPWRTGWASAVLTEGLLVPAGAGYRFAHEELGDWVQGAHLDLDTALRSLVHRWHEEDPGGGARAAEARVPAQRSPRTSRRASTASERGQVQGADAASGAMSSREPRTLPVPRHRIGPVIQALLLLGRRQGAAALSHRLADLIEAMDRLSTRTDGPATAARRQGTGIPTAAAGPDGGAARPGGAEDVGPLRDASWWAAHLLSQTLLRVPDAGRYVEVLRLLAGRIVRRSGAEGGTGEPEGARDVPPGPGHRRHPLGAYAEFGPWFWLRLRLSEADRIDLLRRLVPADGPPRGDGWDGGRDGRRGQAVACRDEGGDSGGERFLDVVARRLVARPRIVQPLLCRWFTDERPLPAEVGVAMRPTVAAAAQALLHARRDLAVDDLTDALVATVHPRAGELLVALAEDEPAALCRAVERWARDGDRRARRGAAASYGLLTAPHATAEADRALLRLSALALLAHPADVDLHGAALALLVRDPQTRDCYLPQALRVFVQGDPQLSAAELVVALPTHREPVIAAIREALTRPGGGAGEVLRSLAGIDAPALALHAAGLVRAYVDSHPEGGAHAAAYIDRRLEHGPVARALLLPLMSGLLRDRPAPAPVRGALARVLAAPGTPASGALRAELLEVLLEFEQGAHRDPVVLDALLCAAATGSARRAPVRTRALVHRTGMLLVRTPEGAARFDRRLVELARDVPGFAQLVTGWLADAPQEWAAVVGPGTRRTVETLSTAMTMPMQAPGRGHGSLRPA
ncbi:serine protease [Streptomyces sp. NBC_00154]|uniref:S1 family peptidase n=1 Tax=Streptomyces sp. NBC_00154 TaxID=2975670 RepID=UPI0022579686|nr:serine protease [Streptomyces sp. NBC_00154]MCX5310287.1 serine protease [Streptomyces sp. NBC_00154]